MFVLCLTLCYDKSLNGDMLILVEPSIRRYFENKPRGRKYRTYKCANVKCVKRGVYVVSAAECAIFGRRKSCERPPIEC